MKKIIYAIIASSTLLVSCTKKSIEPELTSKDEFVITGTLPAEKYDSAWLFLVPMNGPHPRPVDSVMVAKNGSFEFRGNVEQMAVLRLDWHRRMNIQDLLVCTEPGITHVVLDSISSSYGTEQNNALQTWKNNQQEYSEAIRHLVQIRGRFSTEEYEQKYDSISKNIAEKNYSLMKEIGRNTVSVFINTHFSGRIDSLRRAELNELFKDTTNWELPQPGFHK